MATATGVLRHEHEAIQRMLEAAGEAARRLERGERVAPWILAGLLEFFRLFADRCHHGKEEALLFPALERKGVPPAGGPLAVMLAEHEDGRALIARMAEAAGAFEKGAAGAGRRFAEAARTHAALLRQHIEKENGVLFVLAERLLSAAEQAELAAAFEKLEVERMGVGTHERLHALMDRIAGELLD
jgi:hemerythrin-like domain-containing protein